MKSLSGSCVFLLFVTAVLCCVLSPLSFVVLNWFLPQERPLKKLNDYSSDFRVCTTNTFTLASSVSIPIIVR